MLAPSTLGESDDAKGCPPLASGSASVRYPTLLCNISTTSSAPVRRSKFQDRLRALANDTEVQISANPALYQVIVDYGDPQQA